MINLIGLKDAIETKKYYVYLLLNPLKNNEPFYVGKGRNKRCFKHVYEAKTETHIPKPNNHKINTIKKILNSGLELGIEIVFCSDDEQACYEQEKLLIAQYGRVVAKNGLLTNLTLGGEGSLGISHKRPQTEATKQKLSIARKKMLANVDYIPTKHSKEHRHKLTVNNPGGKATAKPIWQIDSITGSVVKEWPSTKSAGESLGLKAYGNIGACANKFKQRTISGFYWRWIGDKDVINGKLVGVEQITEIRTDKSLRAGKQIQQLTLDGTIINTWKNMCVAANTLGINNTSISLAIKQQRPYAGFLWCKMD